MVGNLINKSVTTPRRKHPSVPKLVNAGEVFSICMALSMLMYSAISLTAFHTINRHKPFSVVGVIHNGKPFEALAVKFYELSAV